MYTPILENMGVYIFVLQIEYYYTECGVIGAKLFICTATRILLGVRWVIS